MNDKKYKKCLIYQIFRLLDLIENEENQATVNQIRGLLFNLLED